MFCFQHNSLHSRLTFKLISDTINETNHDCPLIHQKKGKVTQCISHTSTPIIGVRATNMSWWIGLRTNTSTVSALGCLLADNTEVPCSVPTVLFVTNQHLAWSYVLIVLTHNADSASRAMQEMTLRTLGFRQAISGVIVTSPRSDSDVHSVHRLSTETSSTRPTAYLGPVAVCMWAHVIHHSDQTGRTNRAGASARGRTDGRQHLHT